MPKATQYHGKKATEAFDAMFHSFDAVTKLKEYENGQTPNWQLLFHTNFECISLLNNVMRVDVSSISLIRSGGNKIVSGLCFTTYVTISEYIKYSNLIEYILLQQSILLYGGIIAHISLSVAKETKQLKCKIKYNIRNNLYWSITQIVPVLGGCH